MEEDDPEVTPAEQAYARFVERWGSDFEALCAMHPELETELGRLHDQFQRFRPHLVQAARAFPGKDDAADSRRPAGGGPASPFLDPVARAGAVIGDFKLIQLLGQGGMGQVWEAEQMSMSRRVALKLVHLRHVDELALRRFAREARAGGRLNHPGVVTVFGHGESSGQHWIAQELVPGGWNLRDYIDAARTGEVLPADYYCKVAVLVAHLADALQAAHEAGVIHRDLKPQNVLLMPDDWPKLTDFGLARITEEEALSRTGEFAGTYLYMSPEQVAARRMGIDHRTDIFSLGVVLYEMLALQRPFEGDTTHQIAEKILTWDPPNLTKLRSRIPADLAVICTKAIEKRRDHRYQTAGEVAADLRRHLADEPILARAPGPLQRARKWVRRNPTKSVAGAVAAVAFAVISMLLWKVWQSNTALELKTREAEANAEEARTNEQRAQQNELEALRAAEAAEKSLYVSGIRSASWAISDDRAAEAHAQLEACPEDRRGWEWDHLSLRSEQSLLAWEAHPQGVEALAITAESDKVVTGGSDGRISIWDTATGAQLASFAAHNESITSLDVSADGTRIVSASRDSSVRSWDCESCRELSAFADFRGDGYPTAVGFNPRDGSVAFCATDGRVRMWDPVSGRLLATLDGHDMDIPEWTGNMELAPGGPLTTSPLESLSYSGNGQLLVTGGQLGFTRVWQTFPPYCEVGSSMEVTMLGGIRSLSIDSSSDRLLVSTTASASIWDLESRRRVAFLGAANWKGRAEFLDSENRVALAGDDALLHIWRVREGGWESRLRNVKGELYYPHFLGHEAEISCLAVHPSSERIFTGGADGTVRVWSYHPHKAVTAVAFHGDWPFEARGELLALSRDGTRAIALSGLEYYAVVYEDRISVQAFDPTCGVLLEPPRIVSGRSPMAIDLDLTRAFVARSNPEFLQALQAWSEHPREEPDGDFYPGLVEIYDVATWTKLDTLSGHKGAVNAIAVSPDSRTVATGSIDSVRVWNAETGRMLETLDCHEGAVHSLAFSPDGSRLASGAADQTVKITTLGDGDAETLQVALDGTAGLLTFSDNGHWLAGAIEARILIWDAETGVELTRMVCYGGRIHALAFHPMQERIVSGSMDGTIRVWDTRSGEELMVLGGHAESVTSLRFSPDGQRLYSGSTDGTVRIWESDRDSALRVCARRRRPEQAAAMVNELLDAVGLAEEAAKQLDAMELDSELRTEAERQVWVSGDRNARTLNSLSWPVVVDPDSSPESAALALRQATSACEKEPSNPDFLNTLGVAQYRSNLFNEAISTLTGSDEFRSTRGADSDACDWLFMAMSHHRLGAESAAREAWARTLDLLPDDPNEELRKLVEEGRIMLEEK